MNNIEKTINYGENCLIQAAREEDVTTVWDRYEAMQPQCGFGETGLCCRNCWKGPCRIDPLGNGPKVGICGATADVIVARQFIRWIAAGAAAHSAHGKHIVLTLSEFLEGDAPAYSIKDEKKLKSIAEKLNLSPKGKKIEQIAKEVLVATMDDFSRLDSSTPCNWLTATLPAQRIEKLKKVGAMPFNVYEAVSDIMARTHVGCDADATNLLFAGFKGALADLTGESMATAISDVLFGRPKPVLAKASLSVLKKDAINIAVHGHNPVLSEIVCDVAATMNADAKKAGAKEGINVVGICCTGNELLMRHGIPLATNYLSQELAIATGALDAMVVDVQCIMPSIVKVAESYHTEIITTLPENKITGATHIDVDANTATEGAKKIVSLGIEAFSKRNEEKINIPAKQVTAMGGFGPEIIIDMLSKLNEKDPLKPLIDNIVNGNIQGIVLFAGCNNTKATQDNNFMTIAKELARHNVLMLATGCGAVAFAKNGLMNQEATEAYAGDSLKSVLTTIGKAAGLNGPLPLVLNMGSCVDNSRAVEIAVAIANKLGVDLDDLPLVASAPEEMSEKAIAIGSWAVALGIPTHLGIVPQVTGSKFVTEFLTDKVKDTLGGYFIVETDPKKAADKLFNAIKERRKGLGI